MVTRSESSLEEKAWHWYVLWDVFLGIFEGSVSPELESSDLFSGLRLMELRLKIKCVYPLVQLVKTSESWFVKLPLASSYVAWTDIAHFFQYLLLRFAKNAISILTLKWILGKLLTPLLELLVIGLVCHIYSLKWLLLHHFFLVWFLTCFMQVLGWLLEDQVWVLMSSWLTGL